MDYSNKYDIAVPEYFGNTFQMRGAQKLIVEQGRGKGTSVIRVRDGKGLDFVIIPDKGLNVPDVHFESV